MVKINFLHFICLKRRVFINSFVSETDMTQAAEGETDTHTHTHTHTHTYIYIYIYIYIYLCMSLNWPTRSLLSVERVVIMIKPAHYLVLSSAS
jgi:hypothetical protein